MRARPFVSSTRAARDNELITNRIDVRRYQVARLAPARLASITEILSGPKEPTATLSAAAD